MFPLCPPGDHTLFVSGNSAHGKCWGYYIFRQLTFVLSNY